MSDIDPARLDANWRAIRVELDYPRPSRVEQLLRVVRIPAWVTRIVVATPALRRSWFIALLLVGLVGIGAADASDPRGSLFTLLFLAPLAPLLGVALAYGPTADPVYEVQLATPMRGVRLLAVRATTVMVVAAVVISGFALISPVTRPMAAAWLLPAVALTTGSLAAMTWLPPRRASATAAGLWVAIALTVRFISAEEVAAFTPPGQAIALLASVVCVAVVRIRRDAFEQLEYSS